MQRKNDKKHNAGSKDPAFLCSHYRTTAYIFIFSLISCCALITPPLFADETAKRRLKTAQSCTEATVSSALTAAFDLRDRLWLKDANAWFTAYTLKGEALNPLLPQSGSEANSIALHGFVFASDLNCVHLSAPSEQLQIGLRATTYRFHENAGGWSRAMEEGLMMVIDVIKNDATDAWQPRVTSNEFVALPPDATFRKPTTNELPPHDNWPKRECRLAKLWNGSRCVPPNSVLPADPR